MQYSIYYMNHGKVVYIANHTTLDLGHRKFAVRYTPRLWLMVYLLQISSVLGSIFAIYTSLPWFIYIYIVQQSLTGTEASTTLLHG